MLTLVYNFQEILNPLFFNRSYTTSLQNVWENTNLYKVIHKSTNMFSYYCRTLLDNNNWYVTGFSIF